jgi:putative ABC transport system substrate-binding protein
MISMMVVFVGFSSAHANQPKKHYRIGYLSATDLTTDSMRLNLFRRALREIGYAEGQDVSFEYRHASGKGQERQAALAAELVRLKVDVIMVSGGDTVIDSAMGATKTIPIILMGMGSDPVNAGFIQSLARPGGNVTGITFLSRELGGKRLELLKQAAPKLAHVAVIYESRVPGAVREIKEDLPSMARELGVGLKPQPVNDSHSLNRVFAEVVNDGAIGLYAVAAGSLIRASVKPIAEFATKTRLPSVGSVEFVAAGGLVSYDADLEDGCRRVATYVDRILKGTKPADLPVQQASRFNMVINLKAAKQIGLTIPPHVLGRADRVIR